MILMQMALVLYICDTINVKPRNNPDVIMLNCVSKGGRRTRAGDTPHCRGWKGTRGGIFVRRANNRQQLKDVFENRGSVTH